MMIKPFKTEGEAIEMANDTEFGLFASVFTKDITKGLRVAGKIESGMVSINQGFSTDLDTPFGGWKQSGIGREGGIYGLKAFLQEKTIKISEVMGEQKAQCIFFTRSKFLTLVRL